MMDLRGRTREFIDGYSACLDELETQRKTLDLRERIVELGYKNVDLGRKSADFWAESAKRRARVTSFFTLVWLVYVFLLSWWAPVLGAGVLVVALGWMIYQWIAEGFRTRNFNRWFNQAAGEWDKQSEEAQQALDQLAGKPA